MTNNFKNINRVNNYEECMDIIKNYSPDIVVIDLDKSFLNGIDIARIIRTHSPFIQIILSSAKKSAEVLIEAIDLSICSFLYKPIKEDDYIKSINKAISSVQNIKMMRDILNQKESTNAIRLNQECVFELDKKMIINNSISIHLNNNECRLFEILLKHRGSMVTYAQIENYVWQNAEPTKGALRNLVYTLRKKLPDNLLENYSKMGYILNVSHY
jgi:DNA-binding response OmpR family regulator